MGRTGSCVCGADRAIAGLGGHSGRERFDLEEDEAWSKVEKGMRKAVLRRERDALAKHVRTSLSKVSAASSPFKKALAAGVVVQQ